MTKLTDSQCQQSTSTSLRAELVTARKEAIERGSQDATDFYVQGGDPLGPMDCGVYYDNVIAPLNQAGWLHPQVHEYWLDYENLESDPRPIWYLWGWGDQMEVERFKSISDPVLDDDEEDEQAGPDCDEEDEQTESDWMQDLTDSFIDLTFRRIEQESLRRGSSDSPFKDLW